MEIIIVTLTGRRYRLTLVSSNTIEDLKMMIEERDGTPLDQQRLIYKNQQLEDGRNLSDYNIQSGETITLILRLRLRGCGDSMYFFHIINYFNLIKHSYVLISIEIRVHFFVLNAYLFISFTFEPGDKHFLHYDVNPTV